MRSKLVVLVTSGMLLAAAGVVAIGGSAGAGEAPTVQVTIIKKVVGTDPGIAFPITLTCDSQGGTPGLVANDFQIPNGGQQSEVVNLKHGQSATIYVQLPMDEPDLATCRVTEDLTGVTLPAGLTCTPVVAPGSVVVYERGTMLRATGSPAVEVVLFTVTNTCTEAVAAVAAQSRTTG